MKGKKMDVSKYTIGFGITGSFCTHEKIKVEIRRLVELGANVIPIFSYQTLNTDTRFGSAADFVQEVVDITMNEGIRTIGQAEPIGPNNFLDVMVIAPCTGNTLAKLAAGITDTPITMACKSHVRNSRPVVIAVSTNDGLSGSAKNIGALLNYKAYYFVPFGQDDFRKKPRSLMADFNELPEAILAALNGVQMQPILI